MQSANSVQVLDGKKILLVHMGGGIGDLLLSTALLKQIKQNAKDSRCAMMVRREFADAVAGHPFLDDILPIDRLKGGFSRLVRQLRERSYDVAIVLWSTAAVAWLVRLAGIPIRVGQDSRLLYSHLYTHRVRVRSERGDRESHWVDILLDYIRILGCTIEDPEILLHVDSEVYEKAGGLLREAGMKHPLIGLHVGKGLLLSESRWPVKFFARVADAVSSHFNAQVLLTGSRSERALVSSVISHMKSAPLDFSGKTSLKELAALISHCRAFICPDSAPMHIAAAMKVPTLGIFALKSDFPERWKPYGTSCEVVRPDTVRCSRKCVKEKCYYFQCYEDVSTDRIISALERLIKPRH